ncbi:uncharacterized protein LOC110835805 [Zootermopsis nevadensis]|uniref:Uncharacterized protein n=1 Tax=Zootermopsis nevadensis TaxID=136037 RepID=A0A067QV62_ZOONE|nr:uncharacterized protein LOC110835805 [Zootermopsis nevadensis]KDR12947.1 hypothetical protein L798_12904 [Zootermopsis nevadensis]
MDIDYRKFAKILATLDMYLSVAVFMIWVFQPSDDIRLGKYAIFVGIDVDIFYTNNYNHTDKHDVENSSREFFVTLTSMFAISEAVCSAFLLWGFIKNVVGYTDPWMSFKFSSFLLQIGCLTYYFVVNEIWSPSIVIPTSLSIVYSCIALQIVAKAVYQLEEHRSSDTDEKYSFCETVCRSFYTRISRAQEETISAQRAEEGPISAQTDEEGPISAQRAEEGPISAQTDEEGPISAQRDEEGLVSAQRDEEEPVSAQRDEEEPFSAQKPKEGSDSANTTD